jgi:uncharacterized protein (DUF885 family)
MLKSSEDLQKIIDDEWEVRLLADPLMATYVGDHRYNDRFPDSSEEGMRNWLETLKKIQARLQGLDLTGLSSQETLNASILSRLIQDEIDEIGFQAYRMPLSKAGGFHSYLPEQLPFVTPFDTIDDYERYLTRLTLLPGYFKDQTNLMRTGLSSGHIPSISALTGVDIQVENLVPLDPTQHLFYSPFLEFPTTFSTTEQERLRTAGQVVILDYIRPAYLEILAFLRKEYLPAAKDEVGAMHLPDGKAFYRHRIRQFTSLELEAEQVHQTGLAEVERIQMEMQSILQDISFQGSLADFITFLRTDSRFYADTPEALLKEAALILKRIDGELPRLFKTLPRTPYGIRLVPEASAPDTTTAYYFPPSGDGRTAGFYYINTYDLKSRPLYELEALSLHEAVPGHHLQIALQQELQLPNFRRFNGFTAFVEGWALYSERLGLEMGFFKDPTSNFGRLSYEMWRACRLVVDTGLHALDWSRQQAIDFMADHTSLTLLNIANEVDRYLAWPGQALAYKIGELKIRELRSKAEQTLGTRFNLREFHDVLLTSGAVPLDTLEKLVEDWINSILEP